MDVSSNWEKLANAGTFEVKTLKEYTSRPSRIQLSSALNSGAARFPFCVDEPTSIWELHDGLPMGLMPGKITKVATTVPAREDLPESPALSIQKKATKSLAGRLIGCLVADGSDAAIVTNLTKAAAKQGAQVKVIAPKIGGAKAQDGTVIPADFQLAGGPSVLFDCLFLVLSEGGSTTLMSEAAAVASVHDGFAHLKVLGATPEAQPLLDKAGVIADEGVLTVAQGSNVSSFLERAALGRIWKREPTVRKVF